MERVYYISGLDCANCAAKLERHLQEITLFENVIIDFMAQKLIVTCKDEEAFRLGLQEAEKVIAKVDPGVTITEKAKKAKMRATRQSKVPRREAHSHEDACASDKEQPKGEQLGACDCSLVYRQDNDYLTEPCACGSLPGDEVADLENEKIEAAVVKVRRFTTEMRNSLVKIVLGAILFSLTFFSESEIVRFGLYLCTYLIVGGEVLLRATKNIARGQVFDENFLMAIATIGAFGVGEYPEGVMVMLLYQLGELFQNYAVQRSRRSIAELMDIKPEVAHVKVGDRYHTIAPEDVVVGDIIQVRPGERIPLDGVIIEGNSSLNMAALTGEAIPQDVTPGGAVMSGCINISGVLTVRVEKEYEDSTVAKILDLVENASSQKAETENFITKFARYYTPIVVVLATVLAVLPPLILHEPFSDWVYRALVFLVISCPCALVISIPLTFFSGLGVCSRRGILVKGSNYLEALAQLETAVFDKTGTLTTGQFAVTNVQAFNMPEVELLYYAACAESISNHPIAMAVQEANTTAVYSNVVQHAVEIAGLGISAQVDSHPVLVGNYRLMQENDIACELASTANTVVYVAVDGTFCGWIEIADQLKADAEEAVTRLKNLGLSNIVLLTGDNQAVAEQAATQLGITEVFSQLLPGDKVSCLEDVLAKKSARGTVAFTGDGLNDAPVLARADVGIAMGGLGSDAAIEAADVVIMNDQPSKLADAVQIARKTRMIVKQNIVFVLSIKLLVLLLGALGVATMWMAVFADVGVAVIAILNAIRIMRI